MTDVYAAALLDSLPGSKYVSTLRHAELSFRAPLPKPSTLKRARYAFPAGFGVGLRVPTAAIVSARGPLRPDEASDAALAWTIDAADALAARCVVFATPVALTPGARERELLEAFVARLPRVEGRDYVWIPSGLWEADDAVRLAERLGVVVGVDALEQAVPGGAVAYTALSTLGGRTRLSEPMLRSALERVCDGERARAYVVIDSPRSFEQACQLAGLAQAAELVTAG